MTTAKPDLIEFLRATLKQDDGRSDELRTIISEQANMQEFADVVTATLFVAVQRKFLAGDDPREITKFLLETKDLMQLGDQDFVPATTEAVVRAALGEERLLEGIDLVPTIAAQMAVVTRIVKDEKLSEAEIDRLFKKVEDLVL